MNIQSAPAAPMYIPAMFKDQTTGQWETRQLNWTELMEKAKVTRDAELQKLAAAKQSLTPAEVNDLAEQLYKKYDPQSMTQEEYNCFIDDLINGGALNRAEASGMSGRYGIEVDPSAPGGLQEIHAQEDLICSLSDAKGNAMQFLSALARWDKGSLRANEAYSNAAQKAVAVLDAILERRKQSDGRENYSFSKLM